jgi:excisionase family DNA binding protein
MLSPQVFARQAGLSYQQVLHMCKFNQIEAVKTSGGHFKIPEKELDKFFKPNGYVSKEEYERVIRENEKLKTILEQAKIFFVNLNVGEGDINGFANHTDSNRFKTA